MTKGIPRPTQWNDTLYPSQLDAAKAEHVHPSTMRRRIQKGYTCDEDLYSALRKPCSWNGIDYVGIEAAAIANNICYQAMVWRLSKGYTCDEDMQYPPQGMEA